MKINVRVFLLISVLAFACSSKAKKVEELSKEGIEKPPPAGLGDVQHIAFDASPEMTVLLSEGNPEAEMSTSNPRPPTKPLSVAATNQVLSRLDPIKVEKTDKKDFAKRERSLPPPKTGDVIKTKFPSDKMLKPPVAKATDKGAFQLIRYQPEGDVPIVLHLSVTFNEPMVAITSHKDTIANDPPVTLSPMPKGKFRWVGSKTLLFEADGGRFPMATEYTVTVPASTKSKLGNTIKEGKTWKFKTPPLTVQSTYPNYGTHGLDQVMYMGFNQKVDQNEIAKNIKLKTGVFKGMEVQLVDADTVEDAQIKQMVANAKPETFIVFKAKKELPYDSNINVVMAKGTKSAEGPLPTTSDYNFSFKTYGPLKVVEHKCGYRDCRPYDQFYFRLSNNISYDDFDETWITVEPSYPNMTISHSGQWIYVQGLKPGRRTYTVTLSPETTDEFDQKLEGRREFSFEVGAADPSMYSTAGQMTVVDPFGEAGITIYTTNYREVSAEVYEVGPRHWDAYLKYIRDWNYYGKKKVSPPGKRIAKKTIKIDAKPDDLVETLVPLGKELGKDKLGHLFVYITPTKTTKGSSMPQYKPEIRTWVQATQIGLDVMVDQTDLTAWATDLKSGEPVSGVKFKLHASGKTGVSDKSGVSHVELAAWDQSMSKKSEYLLAEKGDDVAFLPAGMWSGGAWYKNVLSDYLGWYVFDDRKMYKPGEKVTVKGWIRALEHREGGAVKLDTGIKSISWVAYGPMGNEMKKGTADVGGFSGFNFDFELPTTPNLGQGYVQINASGARTSGTSYTHYFQVQEFRTPEFKVSAGVAEGPHFADSDSVATVDASYYAGGPLTNADVTWSVNVNGANFRPPNLDKYAFGTWVPWWLSYYNNPNPAKGTSASFQGKTDAAGTHYLRMAFSDIAPPQPMNVTATATVMDVNRQAWTSSKSFVVHPSEFYVGLKTDKYFVKKGEPLEVEIIAADVEGNIVPNRPVKVRATRVAYKWQRGKYIEQEEDPQTCEILTLETASKCTFQTNAGGTYKIAASTVDDYKRENYTKITRWVAGGNTPKSRRVEMEKIQLIPDKDEYRPGDTAEILVQSPIVPAEGIVTYRRSGVVVEKRFTMSEPTTVLNVPIKEQYIPNFFVQVNLVGSQPRLDSNGEPTNDLPRRPAIAQGQIQMKVPPKDRVLDVKVEPANARVEPAANTTAKVTVKDQNGNAVKNAEVAIIVVDEAILSLTGYALADPMTWFYFNRPAGVRDHHLRTLVQLSDPKALQQANNNVGMGSVAKNGKGGGGLLRSVKMKKPASVAMDKKSDAPAAEPMEEMEAEEDGFGDARDEGGVAMAVGGEGKEQGGQSNQKIAVRSNFDPLATFSPAVKTNSAGVATVSYKMPDNLTRYRIMAVAVKDATHYGSGESNVTARLPLMVRPSAPRFLNFGDSFQLPVVVQNQTDEPMTVNVATRVANLKLDGGSKSSMGLSVDIPANERVEVRFPAGTDSVGTARFQIGVAAGKWGDAAEIDLPVWTPATSEAFAVYGVIDQGAIAQPIKRPTEVWPQFGGVKVSTSSTALQALTDAFIYLYEYEYQCAEQISSRMVSVAALRDVLSAFEAEGMPTVAAVNKSMSRDIEELFSRQNYDGGFGFWRKGQRSWPYVSIHATHALARAKQKGYKVPEAKLNQALNHLKNIENYIPYYYSEWARRHIIAYALYVRNIAGQKDTAYGRKLYKRAGGPKGLSFEAVGWMLGVLTGDAKSQTELKEIRRYLNNKVTETAGNAHYAAKTVDGDYVVMHSDRVADGVILEALISDQPKSDLIPKIVSGLMAHRKKGRWGNTQENAFILLALDKYFNKYENQTPDFVARAWLGETYAGEHKFKGRTTETHEIDIAMSYLPKSTKQTKNLYLQKDGKGRMYYRIGMSYAPKSLFLEPASHGFTVERTYEAVDDPGDVKRKDDGTWVFKAGSRVKISLTMVAPTRRYHVALVDPLPAGLETLNAALAVVGDIPDDAQQTMQTGRSNSYGWWWWSRPWYEHQNMRDERSEAFTTLLWGGVHSYVYYARATTPGKFVVPPAKAEEMYHPETFGRSASDRVEVVD